jgi:uncharacterized protein (UPF0276 family)
VSTRFPSPAAAHSSLRAGIGLRAQHHADIVARKPAVGWFEAHSENYFAAGGAQRSCLMKIRADYALSLHGVGLSVGSTDPLNRVHLEQILRLVHDFEPMLVSEHLSWSSVGGRFTNDLLPLPYTEEALRHMVTRVRDVQEVLGRQILIENVSSYLQFSCSRIPEWEFLTSLAVDSGCGILLDVNNVYVSACNHGFDAHVYLNALPRSAVKEIHLAGHTAKRIGRHEILIDTHNSPVCDAVWQLYATALERFSGVPALIEWDADIPALEVLVAEAHKADAIAGVAHVAAA